MLSVLKIRNLALVDDLTWELSPGLVGVTGETGAGKSVIVGAIKLVLGERADRSLIRTGEDSCTVEAVFHLERPVEVNAILGEYSFDPCEENTLVIKRVFTASGGNRQFVNCSPATLPVLKSLGQYLVDLHGPHDHQSLFSQDRQLALLDAFAGANGQADEYQKAYRTWKHAAKELDEVSASGRATEQEIDLLSHQVKEIEMAAFRPGEEEELERKYKLASNGRRIMELCGQIANRLAEGPMSVLSQLREMNRFAGELERVDENLSEMLGGIHRAQVELQEVDDGLREYAEELELNPAELENLEDRVNTLENLKRKYGATIADILAFQAKAKLRLDRIEGRGEEIERLREEVKRSRSEMDRVGRTLGETRQKAILSLAQEISGHLADLGFKKAQFEVALAPLPEPGPLGLEQTDFLFSPNPGEPLKPLRIIASSGEMARVLLAVKSALAKQDSIPLLIFDEIDANVGGGIAQAVGVKMAALSKTHQIISITHMPQVASLASSHFVVTKEYADGRTRSKLHEVKNDDRIAELARMLGGAESSARKHAESLLAEGVGAFQLK